MVQNKSKIEAIVEKYYLLRKLLSSKYLKRMFFFTLVSFFSLNVMNSYAEDSAPIAPTKDLYENITKVSDAQGDTTVKNQVHLVRGETATGLSEFIVDLGGGSVMMTAEQMDKYGVDQSSRYGFLGTVDGNTRLALNNPPQIDVIQHFAEEWVPGKKVENYATFASGYTYLADLKIADLWDMVRNISYVFFIVVLIVAGFMIMFRQKIGGQVAITVYNTIPNVIIGLVLVTFSFAIVGLILDVGALAMRIIMGIFNYPNASDYVYLSTPFQLLEGARKASTYVSALGPNSLAESVRESVTATTGWLGGIVAGAFASIPALIVAVIVLVLFLYAAIKVFITVFKAFIGIIFDTILAPIYLTMSVIPGRESARKDWFNRVLKNTAVFPVVFFLVNLPDFFKLKGIILDMSGIGNATLTSSGGTAGVVESLLGGLLPLFMYFIASEAPKYLNDIFPANASKGSSEAMAALKKMPLVGGFF